MNLVLITFPQFICARCGKSGEWYCYSGSSKGMICTDCSYKYEMCKKCNKESNAKFFWDEDFKDYICLECIHNDKKLLDKFVGDIQSLGDIQS